MEENHELPKWVQNLAVFDTETTGVDTRNARIVTASIATLNHSGEIITKQQWMINPGIPIPEQASAVHGITDEIVQRDGAEPKESIAAINELLRGLFNSETPVVVYNAPYDLSLLKYESLRHGLEPIENPFPIIDPLIIDKQVDRYRKGKRTLGVTAEHYGVSLGDDAHDALADAVAAGRIAIEIAKKFSDQLPNASGELHEAQILWAKQQEESYQQWLQSQGRESNYKTRRTWPV